MTSVMKSPNMMSTTGRMPVIAAPRPIPAMPASEIGESMIRSGPNSSTRPAMTLNGVPVLPVDLLPRDPERLRPRDHLPRGRLRVVRVLAVEVVLAGVDHRQL